MSTLPLSPPVRWIVRHVLIVLTLTLVISLALTIVFSQPFGPTLIYCFFISLFCAASINLLRYGLGWIRWRLLDRLGRAPAEPFDWPGWPLMVLCLLLGTGVGYSLGVEVGNMVTGLQEKSLLSSPLRRVLSVMVIALIPGFGATLFFLSRHRIAAAEARAETLRRQAAETQLRLLESQLEPHMLFNTLANLRVLIGMDADRAQAMLDHLIAFLRATLSASRAERHPLKDEFARLADYLALMQVRMGSRLRFEFDLPEALREVPVPPLLLQPLVENAIKHGLEPHVGGGTLRVRAAEVEGQLLLDVEDDGAGFDAAAARSPEGGFGTVQVRDRLAVACGPQARLELSRLDLSRPAGGGTRARIRMPLPSPTPASGAASGSASESASRPSPCVTR
ncbi:sensor histidine kinase [Roseateles sp. UC29_93]|uniref:sensor histidine kinase n=1 Tax=Roseateles sp. UC29_93 TaxID=3350177 RepID=UPI00366EBE87